MPLYGWILIGVAVLLLLWFISAYNRFVTLRARVKNAWSQIDVQLKRRFDLIPNLVATVKGYASHEKDTLEKVIQARNRYVSAPDPTEKMAANTELTGLLSRLMVLTENYPQLKADTQFIQLQHELSETENKVGFSRQFYNDTVMKYNEKIQQFPGVIVANMMGFREEPYFQAEDAAREAPKVQF